MMVQSGCVLEHILTKMLSSTHSTFTPLAVTVYYIPFDTTLQIFLFCFSGRVFTLPGLAAVLFRGLMLPDSKTLPIVIQDTLPLVAKRASQAELGWLIYMRDKYKKYYQLQCGLDTTSQRMFVLGDGQKVYVDGYDVSTLTAFEFFGCSTHGCIMCQNPRAKNRYYY